MATKIKLLLFNGLNFFGGFVFPTLAIKFMSDFTG